MELNLESKIVLVTGSSKGVGLGIARQFVKEGSKVIVNSTNKKNLDIIGNEFFDKIIGDVSKPSDCKKIFKYIKDTYKKLDILVCNVGSGSSVPPGEENYEEWKRILDLNLLSTTNTVEFGTKLLKKTKGSIVCISSICGIEHLKAPIAYSSSKAALNSYVENISLVLSKQGIRINAVAPGNLIFEGSVWDHKTKDDYNAVNFMLEKEVALGRLGKIEEITNLVLFLSSNVSSFTTGSIFVSDGGQIKSWL